MAGNKARTVAEQDIGVGLAAHSLCAFIRSQYRCGSTPLGALNRFLYHWKIPSFCMGLLHPCSLCNDCGARQFYRHCHLPHLLGFRFIAFNLFLCPSGSSHEPSRISLFYLSQGDSPRLTSFTNPNFYPAVACFHTVHVNTTTHYSYTLCRLCTSILPRVVA